MTFRFKDPDTKKSITVEMTPQGIIVDPRSQQSSVEKLILTTLQLTQKYFTSTEDQAAEVATRLGATILSQDPPSASESDVVY